MPTQQGRLYDSFQGPAVDETKWFPLAFPLPDGSSHVAADPAATVTVADGTLTISLPEFSASHGSQMLDNCKYLLFSTEDFALPETGTLRISATVTADPQNTVPYDLRDGFAALVIGNMETGGIFDCCTSGDVAFAIHEQLAFPGVEHPYTRLVQDPLFGVSTGRGVPTHCTVVFDVDAQSVTWLVNGISVHQVKGEPLPKAVKVGTGIFTVHPVKDDESTSLHGQGMIATWSDIRVE